MRNLSLSAGMVVLTFALSSCGVTSLTPQVLVGASMSDANSSVAIKATDQTDQNGNVTTNYDVGPAGSATFVFSSRPGSQAAYILGYEIIRDVVDGVNIAVMPPRRETGLNIYVTSGYTCARNRSPVVVESCDFNIDTDKEMANGKPTAPLSLNLAGGLASIAIDKKASVSRSTDLRFFGISATGKDFSFDVTGINSRAVLAGK